MSNLSEPTQNKQYQVHNRQNTIEPGATIDGVHAAHEWMAAIIYYTQIERPKKESSFVKKKAEEKCPNQNRSWVPPG